MVETIQTGLNGADIHYWFVDGFGDPERLGHSHYSPVDIALVITVTSFAVQSYFCYQIWTLSRRSLWLCFIIALVRVPDSACIVHVPDALIQSSLAQAGGGLWLSISVSTIYTPTKGRYRALSDPSFRRSRLGGMWSRSQLYSYAYSFRVKWPYDLIVCRQMWSIPAAIADILIAVSMVLLVRHHPIELFTPLTEIPLQLRRAIGKLPQFILLRTVRLTIETNTVTGICSRHTPYERTSDFLLSCRGYRFTYTLFRLPRKLQRDARRSFF